MFDKEKTGVIWSAVERFSAQGIQFFVSIILARLLIPEDYGVIAIALFFLQVFQTINDYGTVNALVYKSNKTDVDYSTALITNILIGSLSYIIVVFLAFPASIFFRMPDLFLVSLVLGINLIIGAFSIVPIAIYTIKLDFKTQSKATIISAIVSGITGIVFAYLGYGVWAIVIQSITQKIISVTLLCKFSSWKFRWTFSKNSFHFLFQYSYKLVLAQLISVIYRNIFTIAIGRSFSASQLGYYNRASNIELISSNNITNIIQRVSNPIFCKNNNNYQKLRNEQIKYIVATSFIVIPLLSGIFVLSDSLIEFLLTDKWLASSWILKAICPVGGLYVLSTFNRNMLSSTGNTGLLFKSEIIKKIFITLIVLISINISFKALIYSQIVIAIFELMIDSYFSFKIVGSNIFKQIFSLRHIIISSLIMALGVRISIISIDSNIYKLGIGLFMGFTIYFFCCYVFNIMGIKLKTNAFIKNILQTKNTF